MRSALPFVFVALGIVSGTAYAVDVSASNPDMEHTALLAILGLNAMSSMVGAVFGQGNAKGLMERVAVLEARIDHMNQGLSDLKEFFGCARRTSEK